MPKKSAAAFGPPQIIPSSASKMQTSKLKGASRNDATTRRKPEKKRI
jgi:hypothetical protein